MLCIEMRQGQGVGNSSLTTRRYRFYFLLPIAYCPGRDRLFRTSKHESRPKKQALFFLICVGQTRVTVLVSVKRTRRKSGFLRDTGALAVGSCGNAEDDLSSAVEVDVLP